MERIYLHRNSLVLNPEINPRHASDDDVTSLASIIRNEGFNEAPWVRPAPGENEMYEIINGGRRKRALDELEWNAPIPCDLFIVDTATARQMALASFVARADLSPADEAVAFHNLAKGGMAVADIAAHFAVPERRVRQRLAIGALPDAIITALREGDLDVKRAEAFTLSQSAERQMEIFTRLSKERNLSEWAIRRAFTDESVSANSGKAKFVTVEAYVAAGGEVTEDLFGKDVWLNNPDLLDKLFGDKLAATMEELKNEGWAWVKPLTGNEAHEAYKYEREEPRARRTLTETEKASLAEAKKQLKDLQREYDALDDIDGDDMTPEQEDHYIELPDLIDTQQEIIDGLTATTWTTKQKAGLGVLICITDRGDIDILHGRRKKGEKPKATREPDPDAGPVDTGDSDTPQPAPVVTEQAGYSDAVEDEMRRVAQKATQLALALKPAMAARMGLAARVCEARTRMHINPFALGVELNQEINSITDKHFGLLLAPFAETETFADVMTILETLPPEHLLALDGVITAVTFEVAALKNTDAQWVINQIDPDMTAEGFTPGEEFFKRLSRDQILLISAEINPDEPVKKGKKPEMVEAILPQVEASGWLPPQLRTPRYQGPGSAAWLEKLSSPATAGEGGAQAPDEGQTAHQPDQIEEAA